MGVIKDIIGNITGNFQFGIGGPRIKRNGTALEARNAADNALANLVAAILTANGVSVTGDDLVLNSDASGAGPRRSRASTRRGSCGGSTITEAAAARTRSSRSSAPSGPARTMARTQS